MNCCEGAELRRQRIHSRNIDLQLKKEESEYNRTMRVLVLGPSGSGKSSIIKQFKISNGFTEQERHREAKNVRITVRHIMEVLIHEMDQSEPPITPHEPSNVPRLQFIRDNILSLPPYHSHFPMVFYEHCNVLWRDENIKQCYRRSDHPIMHSLAIHFMEYSKVLQIGQNEYIPTDSDIFRTQHYQTTGTFHVTDVVDKYKTHFRFYEVINPKPPIWRKYKWISQVAQSMAAILFIVDISSFDVMTENEDGKSVSKLREYLNVFADIKKDKLLKDVSVMTFFNKTDIFREKIDNRNIRVADYFPGFKSYALQPPGVQEPSSSATAYSMESEKVECAMNYFQYLFERMTFTDNSFTSCCTFHFITATDTQNICRVFDVVRTIILENSLRDMNLL